MTNATVDLTKQSDSENVNEINALRKLDANSITRAKELGLLSFDDCVPILGLAIKLFRGITPEVWNSLPDQLRNQTLQSASQLYTYVNQARGFSPNNQNPRTERDGIASGLKASVANVFQALSWLPLFQEKTKLPIKFLQYSKGQLWAYKKSSV